MTEILKAFISDLNHLKFIVGLFIVGCLWFILTAETWVSGLKRLGALVALVLFIFFCFAFVRTLS